MTNTTELVITRVFNAPRDLIFKCVTDPEHLTKFWGPVGTRAPLDRIKVDLRPGGVFETVMVNEATGEEYPSRGVYTEIDPPGKLAWTEPDVGMTTTTLPTPMMIPSAVKADRSLFRRKARIAILNVDAALTFRCAPESPFAKLSHYPIRHRFSRARVWQWCGPQLVDRSRSVHRA